MKQLISIAFLIGCLSTLPCIGQSSIYPQKSVLDRAEEAYSSKNWKQVVSIYKTLTKKSPYHGDFHYRIGRASFMLRDYVNSKKHFEEALKNGISTNDGYAYYYLARIEARLGNEDNAYKLLSTSINYSPDYISIAKREDDFRKYTSSKKTIELLGISVKKKENPSEAWREELLYLKNRMEKSHYNIFHYTSKEKWDSIISNFYNSMPNLTTNQIMTKFSEIGALAMDSHSYANPMFGNALNYVYNMLPVEFYYFKDKLFIRAASNPYSSLVGKEVVKIGDFNTNDIYRMFKQTPVTGLDNDFQLKWQLPWLLRSPELLQGKGILKDPGNVKVLLRGEKGKLTQHTIKPNMVMNPSVMSSIAPDDWFHMNSSSKNPIPLYLKKPNTTFWMQYLKKENLMYVQINNMRDMENEPMAGFTDRFLKNARDNKAKAIVIDVRLNNGGNAQLGRSLVKKMLKSSYNKKGKLFVIIGRNTFSATMPPIAALDKWSEAIFVGEPTGTRPNFIAEGNMFQLPYSRMYASVSNNYWQGGFNSNDSRKWIAPELGAEPNVEDYKNNIDSALKAIVNYLD